MKKVMLSCAKAQGREATERGSASTAVTRGEQRELEAECDCSFTEKSQLGGEIKASKLQAYPVTGTLMTVPTPSRVTRRFSPEPGHDHANSTPELHCGSSPNRIPSRPG
eukprot:3236664-Rhodomonas_salina.2